MALPIEKIDDHEWVWQRYRENFPRHLMGVTRYLHAEVMHALLGEFGHQQLRLSFEPYIALIGQEGTRLSDIADTLGISKQAANQTANQIEAAGYIQRIADPDDGRAKLATLTARGQQLRTDGTEMAHRHQRQLNDMAGASAIAEASAALFRFCQHHQLPPVQLAREPPAEQAVMIALLPRVSDHINQRLMRLTMARGHPDLKPHFGQVLAFVGPHGGRIQPLAELNNVSKQAISAIATELEELGYIHRQVDPRDARQVVLRYTASGRDLIADSVAAVDDLEQEFTGLLGAAAFSRLKETLQTLYRALHLEEDLFGNETPADIRALARQLHQQLGQQGAQALGELLCASTGKVN
jgi:DNA-binding MarR family transcriptional regulator